MNSTTEPHGSKNVGKQQTISLQQWIEKSRPRHLALSPIAASKYVNSSISIALNLTKCLVDAETAEKHEGSNPLPLANIVPENVFVQFRGTSQSSEVFNQSVLHPSSRKTAAAGGTAWEDPDENMFAAFLGKGRIEQPTPEKSEQNDDSIGHTPMDNSDGWEELSDSLSVVGDPEDMPWYESDEKKFIDLLDSIEEPDRQEHDNGAVSCGVVVKGDKMSRLAALGRILFELFSGQKPGSTLFEQQDIPNLSGFSSGITLRDTVPNDRMNDSNARDLRPNSVDRNSKFAANIHPSSTAQLELLGVPQSLCTLVGNLLDCSQGEFCGDDAYQSFSDVQSDLQLMLDDPSRFLDDVDVGSRPSFSIGSKLYGREREIAKIDEAYEKYTRGECSAILISGEAGVGKTALAMHVKDVTLKADGCFFSGKFDQSHDRKPLSVIGSTLDQCCKIFARDSSRKQKKDFATALEREVGTHLSTLMELLPNLSKICPLPRRLETSHDCTDSARRIRYLVCTLVQILSSSLSRPITIFLDDLQWANPSSLLLIRGLLGEVNLSKRLLFTCCFRNQQDLNEGPLLTWLRSISENPILRIDLDNLDVGRVNCFMSDALRLPPRITLPLSSVVHHKTRGNPLFLLRIIESLKDGGCLYFSLKLRRWMWDIEKITDLEIADDVVTLLTKEILKLPEELQLGLKVAACMSGNFDKALTGILSDAVEVDLKNILSKVAERGFIHDDGSQYRFVHDRIQQAAYDIMSSRQRELYHAKFGLAICAYALEEGRRDDMFFLSVNQINRGGPQSILDSKKKEMIASLNLKAGKRSIELSDFHSAFKFFEHGISFLRTDHWENQYDLSLKLFEEIAEAACVLNFSKAAKIYADNVLSHARCFDDKLHTLYVTVAALRHALLPIEAKKHAFDILSQIGEDLPRSFDCSELQADIRTMGNKIESMTDDSIFNMKQMQKKSSTLIKLYRILFHVLFLVEPSRMAAVSLRMVELTFSEGLCSTSPSGFASFGIILVSLGYPACAYRVGTLALRLVARLKSTGLDCCNESDVIFAVYQFILWTSEPFQSVSESHLRGYLVGKQSGDILSTISNYKVFVISSFFSGKDLALVKKNTFHLLNEFTHPIERKMMNGAIALLFEVVALTEGPDAITSQRFHQLPSTSDMVEFTKSTKNADLRLVLKIYQMIRAFFFEEYNGISLDDGIFESISKLKCSLRIVYLSGIFYEGLVSYRMARQTGEEKWMEKGDVSLSSMTWWSQFSSWNFSNKALLLDAEKMFCQGDSDRASMQYEEAIKCSHKHRFLHEEAIAYELAGMFYYERGLHQKSCEFLTSAKDKYQIWGATAKADLVDKFMKDQLDSILLHPVKTLVSNPVGLTEAMTTKRQR